jgi:hypothetical protein
MMVSLKTLLEVAPFRQEQRDELLRIYDELTENEKMKLSTTAWIALSQMYFARVKYETDKLLEIQEGKRTYNRNDFSDVEAKITYEFAHRLGASRTAEEIAEVRATFEQYR